MAVRIYTDEERLERKRQRSREYFLRNREKCKAATLAHYHANKDELNRKKRETAVAAKLANKPTPAAVYYSKHRDELCRKKREKRAAVKLAKAQAKLAQVEPQKVSEDPKLAVLTQQLQLQQV